jgi:hypothetical protein
MSKAAAGASSIRALVLSIQRRRRGTSAYAAMQWPLMRRAHKRTQESHWTRGLSSP